MEVQRPRMWAAPLGSRIRCTDRFVVPVNLAPEMQKYAAVLWPRRRRLKLGIEHGRRRVDHTDLLALALKE